MKQDKQTNTKNPDRGLFRRGRRWYLRAYVPKKGKKIFALKPPGSKNATTDKAIARTLARQIREEIKSAGRPKPTYALSELIDTFAKVGALTATPSQARRNAAIVKKFREDQGVESPSEITTEAIESYLTNLHIKPKNAPTGWQPRKPATLWNHKAALSRFCKFLKDRALLDTNPTQGIDLPTLEKMPPIFLQPSQIDQALAVAKEHNIYSEIATAIFTGLRRSELRQMRWTDIDYSMPVLRVPKSKSGRPRTVPLSQMAIAALKDQEKRSGNQEYVFPGRGKKNLSGMRGLEWWSNAIKPLQDAMPIFQERQAETVGRGWHLLRHTFASRLAQEGVSIAKICEWLGHSDIRTTMIYAHLQPKYDSDIEKLHG